VKLHIRQPFRYTSDATQSHKDAVIMITLCSKMLGKNVFTGYLVTYEEFSELCIEVPLAHNIYLKNLSYKQVVNTILTQNSVDIPPWKFYPVEHPDYIKGIGLLDIYLRANIVKHSKYNSKSVKYKDIRYRSIDRSTYWDCLMEVLL